MIKKAVEDVIKNIFQVKGSLFTIFQRLGAFFHQDISQGVFLRKTPLLLLLLW